MRVKKRNVLFTRSKLGGVWDCPFRERGRVFLETGETFRASRWMLAMMAAHRRNTPPFLITTMNKDINPSTSLPNIVCPTAAQPDHSWEVELNLRETQPCVGFSKTNKTECWLSPIFFCFLPSSSRKSVATGKSGKKSRDFHTGAPSHSFVSRARTRRESFPSIKTKLKTFSASFPSNPRSPAQEHF